MKKEKVKTEKGWKTLLLAFSLLLFTSANAVAEAVYVLQANIGDCRILRNGNTYWFVEDIDFTAAATESAMTVESGAKVEIVIPKAVSVKLTGGAANGTTGAGAGIEVPQGATLVIRGAGELFATGGNAANGADGGQGASGYVSSARPQTTSATGGAGGFGGGGAGAGIGGAGGNGGAGGAGGAVVYDVYPKCTKPGNSGANGVSGAKGGDCGTIEICEKVTVIAHGGTAGANGAGGKGVDWAALENGWWTSAAYGGGGGGGGGGGSWGAGIGGGGGGGGGAGGGGGSGMSYFHYNTSAIAAMKNGKGGEGGRGDGSSVGGKGEDRCHKMVEYNGSKAETETKDDGYGRGGSGGSGGAAGAKGGDGTLQMDPTSSCTSAGAYDVGRISDTERIRWENNKLWRVINGGYAEISYETVNGGTANLDGGKWYVVTGVVTRAARINVGEGSAANLVLLDRAALTVDCGQNRHQTGIWVPQDRAFNIFGIASGTLTAAGGFNTAGIGGEEEQSMGALTIYGGTVTARGGEYGAGIGGGYEGAGGTVTINGGTVTTSGGGYGAGIGGGWFGAGGIVTINGGAVAAFGGNYQSPIVGSLSIGSHVFRVDGNHYRERACVSFRRPPNYLRLVSAVDEMGLTLPVSTRGGDVFIGALAIPLVNLTFDIVEQGYRFTSPNEIMVGPFDESVALPSEALPQVRIAELSLVMPNSLCISSAVAENGTPAKVTTRDGITYLSTFPNAGRVTLTFAPNDVGCHIVGDNVITVDPIEDNATLPASAIPQAVENQIAGPVKYLLADGSEASTTGVRRISHAASQQDTLSSGWYVTAGDMRTSVLHVRGTVNLILADGATLTVDGGIRVDPGNTLNIFCQREMTGALVANGHDHYAGIGGGNHGNGGTVTINGGTVTATGGRYGAGIGGGDEGAGGTVTINGGIVMARGSDCGAGIGGGYGGTGGTVTINGGTVTATSDSDAGIGGGYGGTGGTVTINGGTVTASGGSRGAGIGGGYCSAGGTVTINGGSVTATGGEDGAGIGGGERGAGGNVTINGGSVKASSIRNSPKNAANAPLYCVTVKVEGLGVEKLSVKGLGDYGTNDIYPIDGKVYLYLPDGTHRFTLSDGTTACRYYAVVKGRAITAEPLGPLGFFVNDKDVGEGVGDGWAYDGSTLLLNSAQTYVLSGEATNDEVQVKVAASGATVVLSNAVVYASERPALDVTENASLLMAGGASYLAATNNAAAVTVASQSKLSVDLASAADRLGAMIGVFNYGLVPAIGGTGTVTVEDGTFFVWSDDLAVGLPNFDVAPCEAMQTGDTPEELRYTMMDWHLKRCVLVAPGVEITVLNDIPHVSDITISNEVQVIEGINLPSPGTIYHVFVGDNVFVGYTLEEGYSSQMPNPLVYPAVENFIVVDANAIPTVPNIPYRAWNETTRQMEDCVCTNYTVVTSQTTTFESNRWYVVEDAVSCGKIQVDGAAYLILCDDATLTATGGQWAPGVEVRGENSLHIYGQVGGTGALVANGGYHGAGIGAGSSHVAAGTVTIDGGMVRATGSDYGAGIGGGFGAAGGTVTVNGGMVTARGASFGAGIGGGNGASGGTVTINGGMVTANGGSKAAGIGGGDEGAGGTVMVNGGTVTATGGGGAVDIGRGNNTRASEGSLTIDGGSVKARSCESQPMNANGAPLYCVTAKVEGLRVEKLRVEGLGEYGTNDIYAIDGKVYLYLPNGTHRFSLSDGTTTYCYCAVVRRRAVTVEPLVPVGFFVNGEDIGNAASGEGWEYDRDGRILVLNAVGPFDLSGAATNDEVQVKVAAADARVAFSNAVVFTEGRAALDVAENAALLMAGGASYLGATNESAAVSVAAGAALAVGLAPGADAAEAMIGVFNYGEAKAISGQGLVAVSGGTLAVWADHQAVETPDAFTCGAGEVLMTGVDPEVLRYAMSCGTEPCVLVTPGVTVTVKDIPHVADFTVSNAVQEIEGAAVTGGTEYRVLPGEDVYAYYTLEEGYFSKSANPLVHTALESNVTVTADAIQVVPTIPYRAWNATARQMEDNVCTNYIVVTNATATFEDDGWYVVTNDVGCSAITVDGAAHLILCDDATLTAAALTGGSLSVYAQAENGGVLVPAVVDTALMVIGGNVKAGSVTTQAKNAMGEDVYCVTVEVGQRGGETPPPQGEVHSGGGAVSAALVLGLDGYGIEKARLIDGKVYLWLPNGTHYFTLSVALSDETTYYCYCAEVNGANITVRPVPPPEPITPGEPSKSYATAAEATNAANRAVLVPTEKVLEVLETDEAIMTYCNLFGFAVTGGGEAWYVKSVLTPEAWTNLAQSAQEATRQIPLADIAALPLDTPTNVTANCGVPGFYYSFYEGGTVTNLQALANEKGRNVLCGTNKEVKFEGVVKPSDAAGFFSVGARETPGVQPSDRAVPAGAPIITPAFVEE